MTEQRTATLSDIEQDQKVTGHIYLLSHEAALLSFRAKNRGQLVLDTIHEIAQDFVEKYETLPEEERMATLQRYRQDVIERASVIFPHHQERRHSPIYATGWTLPKPFVETLSTISRDANISNDNLISSVICDAITGKCQ